MRPGDEDEFRILLQGVHEFYGKEVSSFAASVWWQALRPFDIAAVRDALGRHVVNPDAGQWLPKPADIVRMIGGRTVDGAQRAWSKVDAAMRQIGPYRTVVFDDPRIHRVITDMGGWVALSRKDEKEWPFVAKEFETRFRGFAMRNEMPTEFPGKLVGIAEAENARSGQPIPDPVLIGDTERAQRVLQVGQEGAGLRAIPLGELAKRLSA